jgi:2-polyprenyl-3-methyl-5-hydroxy-6-metoxy-1,4-benzoquinol methylase
MNEYADEEVMDTKVPSNYTSSLKGDKVASDYRADVALNILEAHGNVSRKSPIVDIGCGYGNLLHKLQDCGYGNALGIEPIATVVEDLQSEDIQAHMGDVEQGIAWINNESVEAVICLEVLEHLYDPAGAVKEINRWLKPGGILIASVPNEYRLIQRLRVLRGQPIADVSKVGGHIKFFHWKTLPEMIEECGYVIDQQFGEGGLGMRKIIPGYHSILRSFPSVLAKWIFVVAIKQ